MENRKKPKPHPELTGTTEVPATPEIDTSSISFDGSIFELDLVHDTSAFMCDLVLYYTLDQQLYAERQRVIPDSLTSARIEFTLESSDAIPVMLEVYAFDINLTLYLNSSFTIKPQTYYEAVTTVENGYGCFGSVVRKQFDLNGF